MITLFDIDTGNELGQLSCGPVNVPQRGDHLFISADRRYQVVFREFVLHDNSGYRVEKFNVYLQPLQDDED